MGADVAWPREPHVIAISVELFDIDCAIHGQPLAASLTIARPLGHVRVGVPTMRAEHAGPPSFSCGAPIDDQLAPCDIR